MGTSEGRGGAVRAGDVVGALLGGALGRELSAAARAARAWYAANGDRERAHTTGVWLRKSGRAGVDPVMVVALDSNLLAGELGTNKDLYLQRLAFHGIAVSDVRFTVGKNRTQEAPVRSGLMSLSAREGTRAPQPVPELTPAELDRVARATSELPDGLKQSVSRAMCATIRRSKGGNTHNA